MRCLTPDRTSESFPAASDHGEPDRNGEQRGNSNIQREHNRPHPKPRDELKQIQHPTLKLKHQPAKYRLRGAGLACPFVRCDRRMCCCHINRTWRTPTGMLTAKEGGGETR